MRAGGSAADCRGAGSAAAWTQVLRAGPVLGRGVPAPLLLRLPGPLREITLPGLLGGAARLLERPVAGEVLQRLGGTQIGGQRRGGAGGGQLPGRGGGFERELPAALQRAGPLGLGGGVPAQQGGVLAAQVGELHALAAQLRLQPGAQLPRLLQVGLQLGDPLLGPPLVTGPGPGQLRDPAAGLPVPAAHQIRAGHGGGCGGCRQTAQDQGLGEQPGASGTENRDSDDCRRRKDSVQRWRMAMASTWHGLKFTVCTGHLGGRPAICSLPVT